MTTNKEIEDIDRLLTVFGNRIYGQAFDLIYRDPHQWSTRPCSTCHAVSGIIGRKFGCELYAARANEQTREG